MRTNIQNIPLGGRFSYLKPDGTVSNRIWTITGRLNTGDDESWRISLSEWRPNMKDFIPYGPRCWLGQVHASHDTVYERNNTDNSFGNEVWFID